VKYSKLFSPHFFAFPQSLNRSHQDFQHIDNGHSIPASVFNTALLSATCHRMHAAAFNALRAAHRPLSRPACRIVAGPRCSLPCRNFHSSSVTYRIPATGSTPATNDAEKIPPETPGTVPDESKTEGKGVESTESVAETDNSPFPTRKNGKTVSGRMKENRLRQTEGLPPFVLPEAFLQNCGRVTCSCEG
jgi:hypothetical protein